MQADAERSLERLHEAAEVQLKKVMDNNSTAQGNGAPLDLDSFMVRAVWVHAACADLPGCTQEHQLLRA
eukprot:934244-Pelagomonas_calceolata.AAC.1